MKSFKFLFCFLLCVLPCVFTERMSQTDLDYHMEMLAKSIGITKKDLQECLNKVDTDLETISELGNAALMEPSPQTHDMAMKVGCFGACIYKKNGVFVNSKIVPERVLELGTKGLSPDNMDFLRAKLLECSNRASNETGECEIVLSFSRCVMHVMSNTG